MFQLSAKFLFWLTHNRSRKSVNVVNITSAAQLSFTGTCCVVGPVLSALRTFLNYLKGRYLYLPHLAKVNEVPERWRLVPKLTQQVGGGIRSRTLVWPTQVHLLPKKGYWEERGAVMDARLREVTCTLALPPASATPPLPRPRLLVCEGRQFARQLWGPLITGFSQMLCYMSHNKVFCSVGVSLANL